MGTGQVAAVVHRMVVVARDCRGDLTSGGSVSSAARRAAAAGGLTLVAEATHAYVRMVCLWRFCSLSLIL